MTTKIFHINYSSFNHYEEPVSDAFFEYLVFPCNDETQILMDYSIKHSLGNETFLSKNSLGFDAIRISPKGTFKELNFSFNATVQKKEKTINFYDQHSIDDQISEVLGMDFYIENHLYITQTQFTKLSPENQKHVYQFDRKITFLDYFDRLNSYVHSLINYQIDATSVDTIADEVLTIKKGVCQDFSHLFISMARENKLACRYVSGYLDQGHDFIGSAMMHAWVEGYIPGLGWIGFDPTNNLRVDKHYIKVSHGKDYSDCATIKGVIHTGGKNKTSHQVYIAEQ